MNEQNNNQPVNNGINYNTPNVSPGMGGVSVPNPGVVNQVPPVMPNPVPETPINMVTPTPVEAPIANPMPEPVAPNPVPETPLNVGSPSPVEAPVTPTPQPVVNEIINNSVPPMNPVIGSQELPQENSLPEEKPRKKASPIVIIALILLLLVSAVVGYYFLLETPQKIFGGAYDKLMASSSRSLDGYVNYSLKLNANAGDSLKEYTDIINNVAFSGIIGYEESAKKINSKNNVTYKGKELVDASVLVETASSSAYVMLNGIYDKVLMYKNEDTGSEALSVDTNINDYINLKDGIVRVIKKTLESADYKKELVALDGSRVTKVTLFVNQKFNDNYYDNLAQDNSFLNAYAKILGSTANQVKEDLLKEKTEFKDVNFIITLYTSLITNKFLKLEMSDNEDNIVVTNKDNSYDYVVKENGTVTYNGSVKITKKGNDTEIVSMATLPDENMSFSITLTYSKAEKLADLDKSNAVDVNKLTDAEMEEITSKFMTSEGIKELYKEFE